MKRLLVPAFCCLLLAALAPKANAQAANPEAHVAIAKAAAYEPGQDLTNLFGMCDPPPPVVRQRRSRPRRPPLHEGLRLPRDQWYTEPAKVFDNLYYVGATRVTDVTIWAITTSEGIILIDAGSDSKPKI